VSGRSSARSYGYHPHAAAELVEEAEYLRAEGRDVAEAFEAEVDNAIGRLLQFPEIGPEIRRRGDLRFRKWKLESFRYNLVYAVIGDEIRIYAVAHHSRRPGYWLYRLRTP
jgi:plasmid stabilization system protein ParE